MHLEKIRTSSRTTHLFGMLKGNTGIGSEAWARMSICLSLKQRGIPNPDEYNLDGTEFTLERLFPHNRGIYIALLASRLKEDGLDQETYLAEMARAHLNRGAISLKQRINNFADIHGFMGEMGAGALK